MSRRCHGNKAGGRAREPQEGRAALRTRSARVGGGQGLPGRVGETRPCCPHPLPQPQPRALSLRLPGGAGSPRVFASAKFSGECASARAGWCMRVRSPTWARPWGPGGGEPASRPLPGPAARPAPRCRRRRPRRFPALSPLRLLPHFRGSGSPGGSHSRTRRSPRWPPPPRRQRSARAPVGGTEAGAGGWAGRGRAGGGPGGVQRACGCNFTLKRRRRLGLGSPPWVAVGGREGRDRHRDSGLG